MSATVHPALDFIVRMRRRAPWIGPLVALLVVYAIFAIASPDSFLRVQVALAMARQTVIVAICALGMTMVIVTGGIDLSAGSLVAFTTVVIARMLKSGASAPMAIFVALLAAASIGAVIGGLVGRMKLMPFIVTLGAMSMLRGTAKGLANEQKIDCPARGLENVLTSSFSAPGIWITVALVIAIASLLTYTRFGRHVFAVGSNEAAARLCGIDTVRVKMMVYALSSTLIGIAGVMEFSSLTVGDPTDSIGLELDVIAAVVIGGARLEGGEGSIAGSMLGALLMTVIRTGGVSLGMPNWVQEIATGAIIVLASALDRASQSRTRS